MESAKAKCMRPPLCSSRSISIVRYSLVTQAKVPVSPRLCLSLECGSGRRELENMP